MLLRNGDFTMRNGMELVYQLSNSEITEVEALEKRNNETKNIFFKIDPNTLSGASDQAQNQEPSHIVYYKENKLIGYMAVSCFGEEEMEVSPIMSEDADAFYEMYDAVVKQATQRGVEKVLFIIDCNNLFLVRLIQNLGLTFSFAENRMNFNETKFQLMQKHKIMMRDAVCADSEEIMRLDEVAFGKDLDGMKTELPKAVDMTGIKLALLDGAVIGKIKIHENNGIFGIYAFVVHQKWRGKGFGRKILTTTIQTILEKGYKKIYLEVSTENPNAQHLYETSGFAVEAKFDYYELALL